MILSTLNIGSHGFVLDFPKDFLPMRMIMSLYPKNIIFISTKLFGKFRVNPRGLMLKMNNIITFGVSCPYIYY